MTDPVDVGLGDAFDSALNLTLDLEGGFSDRAADSGGRTNYGITHTTYDLWRTQYDLPVRDVAMITEKEVRQIYFDEYWISCRADKLPRPLGALVFDFAVNSGPARAARFLQRTIGARRDGRIGPRSLDAVARMWDHDPDHVCDIYLLLRELFFRRLVRRRPKDRANLKGWENRIANIRRRLPTL